MKSSIITFSLLFFLVSYTYSQKTHKSIEQIHVDSLIGTQFDRELVSDSINFEIRIWFCDFFSPDKFIQIQKDSLGNWDYYLGYYKFIGEDYSIVFQDLMKKEINWENFEKELDYFLNADIPSQDKLDMKVEIDGRFYRIPDSFFTSILDGSDITIEIFDNITRKIINFNNPWIYLEKLKKANFPAKEHEIFVRFVNFLMKEFDYMSLRKVQLRDILDKNSKKNN